MGCGYADQQSSCLLFADSYIKTLKGIVNWIQVRLWGLLIINHYTLSERTSLNSTIYVRRKSHVHTSILHPKIRLATMDDATKERLRLDALHNDELRRIDMAQKQERAHIAQIQGQNYNHQKAMLDLEHKATITHQRALNDQEYEHRKRMLKLEHQYTPATIVVEPTQSFPECTDSESPSEAAANPGQGLTESGDTGSSNHKPQDRPSSKADYFMSMAKRAAERRADKRRGSLKPSLPQSRENSHQRRHLSW